MGLLKRMTYVISASLLLVSSAYAEQTLSLTQANGQVVINLNSATSSFGTITFSGQAADVMFNKLPVPTSLLALQTRNINGDLIQTRKGVSYTCTQTSLPQPACDHGVCPQIVLPGPTYSCTATISLSNGELDYLPSTPKPLPIPIPVPVPVHGPVAQ